MNQQNNWTDLIIERSATPAPLSEDRFRAWMSRQNIFISSLMDEQMLPYREAARNYVISMGARAVMWEEITPQDKNPVQAFLDGVEQSNLFLLILGSRYGIKDSTGYSPTHKEAERAATNRIPRLLFTLAGLPSSERDGPLNDWLGSLYNDVSGNAVASPDNLESQLNAILRNQAAQTERDWIKLGKIVFPGKVKSEWGGSAGNGGMFTVTARVTEGSVRRALMALKQPYANSRSQTDRLTWPNQSYPIRIGGIVAESEFASEDAVQITCATPQNWSGESGSSSAITSAAFAFSGGRGRRGVSLVEMAGIWARRAILGEQYQPDGGLDMVHHSTTPEDQTLPEVLSDTNARGWLAEGLTRLYAVEEVSRRFGGSFDHLQIGPATAKQIKIDGTFTGIMDVSNNRQIVNIQGSIPLKI